MGHTRQLKNLLGYTPVLPTEEDLDIEKVVVRYHPDADTLYVHFYGLGQPAVSVDLNEYLYVRVNDETRRVIGIQIEGYLEFAVRDDPRWLDWAELAGIDPAEIERVRAEISLDKKRAAALQATFDELQLATA
ncbi:MAG TPA: DUF2283 domain-containing protein [Thermomicrobiales bacterium]|mgnify:CR=1 FL=1|nr:DUF2283 domain-containing protein [Thermomicrobiales bacterium]